MGNSSEGRDSSKGCCEASEWVAQSGPPEEGAGNARRPTKTESIAAEGEKHSVVREGDPLGSVRSVFRVRNPVPS